MISKLPGATILALGLLAPVAHAGEKDTSPSSRSASSYEEAADAAYYALLLYFGEEYVDSLSDEEVLEFLLAFDEFGFHDIPAYWGEDCYYSYGGSSESTYSQKSTAD